MATLGVPDERAALDPLNTSEVRAFARWLGRRDGPRAQEQAEALQKQDTTAMDLPYLRRMFDRWLKNT